MILALTGAGISRASGIATFLEMPELRQVLDRQFKRKHPEKFQATILKMLDTCNRSKPNDAHMVLAEYSIPVITMNIDNLHRLALEEVGESKDRVDKLITELHGNLYRNNIVLYGDQAPMYERAEFLVRRLAKEDKFIIVGTSYYTAIASKLRSIAEKAGADIVEVNDRAEDTLRCIVEKHRESLGDIDEYLKREIKF